MSIEQPQQQINPRKQRLGALKQFVLFNMIGLLNTLVDFIAYGILVWAGLYVLPAQVISYSAGMVNSYVLNSLFTFKGDAKQASGLKADSGRATRFVMLNAGVLGVSMILLYVLTEAAGLGPLLAKLLATGVTVVLNFAGSKWWVFRRA
ncbi:Putative flippase GtrA (transmembrane translocase of bactoprenol-linked glucose) [Paenibacillus catalpae]|uniref:Putative flippase GtrA (Transmembrane translocase of bactoprenol-linked glucose) n=1 Tax=Paenibacillus catalpae TaxID=1045775 RepID=A0A1I2HPA7_9BACL|nr:GtrA family protein [Paenibacillus catalpae]SFF32185.1 Putative flippase GtrA (transmembrane translocase of bactoprenol-linked glucose) [Paenibacillus catalpae]